MEMFDYVVVITSIIIGRAITHRWWWEYRLREIETWTFEPYFFVLTYAFVIYLSCAMLFPKDFHEYDGFKGYCYSRRRWFFGRLRSGRSSTCPIPGSRAPITSRAWGSSIQSPRVCCWL